MIIDFMLYSLALTTLATCAAMVSERVGTQAGLPRRWSWLMGFLVVVLATLIVPLRRSAAPAAVPTIPPAAAIASGATASDPVLTVEQELLPSLTSESSKTATPTLRNRLTTFENEAGFIWGAGTLAILAFAIAGQLRLMSRRRTWTSARIHDVDVLISQRDGPATIGVIAPRVVVPGWIDEMTPSAQRLIIAHEAEHIAARDPLLIRAAAFVPLLMPWNLPIWFMLRRLGLAIEMDCDQRVLHPCRAGGRIDLTSYAELLFLVAQRRTPDALDLRPALLRRPSLLHQRIVSMTSPQRPYRKGRLMLSGALLGALTWLIVATPAPRLFAQRPGIVLPANVLRIAGSLMSTPLPPSDLPQVKSLLQRHYPALLTAKPGAPYLHASLLSSGVGFIRSQNGQITDTLSLTMIHQVIQLMRDAAPIMSIPENELPFEYGTPGALANALNRLAAIAGDDSMLMAKSKKMSRTRNNHHARLLALPRLKPGEKRTPEIQRSWDSLKPEAENGRQVSTAGNRLHVQRSFLDSIVAAERAVAAARTNVEELRRAARERWGWLIGANAPVFWLTSSEATQLKMSADSAALRKLIVSRALSISDAAKELVRRISAIDVVQLPSGSVGPLPAKIYFVTLKAER